MNIKQYSFKDSSFIKNIAWDYDSESLFVKFNSGTTWVYYGVPNSVYDSLLAASSIGSFFNKNIRDHYPSQRINYSFKDVEKEEQAQE